MVFLYFLLQLIVCVWFCVRHYPLQNTFLFPLASLSIWSSGWFVWQPIWSSGLLRKSDVFRSSLQILHLNFFKGTSAVKRYGPNWAVLRECEHETL